MNKIVEFSFPYVDIYFENVLKIQEAERKSYRAEIMEKFSITVFCLALSLILVLIKIKLDDTGANATEYRTIQAMIHLAMSICEIVISLLLTLLLATTVDLIVFLTKTPFTKKRFAKANKDKIIKMIEKDAGCYVNRSALDLNSKGIVTGINKDCISLKQYLEKCLKSEALEEMSKTV